MELQKELCRVSELVPMGSTDCTYSIPPNRPSRPRTKSKEHVYNPAPSLRLTHHPEKLRVRQHAREVDLRYLQPKGG